MLHYVISYYLLLYYRPDLHRLCFAHGLQNKLFQIIPLVRSQLLLQRDGGAVVWIQESSMASELVERKH